MKENYDFIDKLICNNPLLGKAFRRLYDYFKKHTAITDGIHVSAGLGMGLMIASKEWLLVGVFFFAIGLLGHVWAYLKGGKE